jgi:hypothetical protein
MNGWRFHACLFSILIWDSPDLPFLSGKAHQHPDSTGHRDCKLSVAGETDACDISTLPTPSRTGCKESDQEKGQQRCASSSGNVPGFQMVSRGQKPCTRCRRLGDILLILFGHTVYCEIPTMWCQVGLWWNTSLVHWGYQLSCSWGHHIEPLKRIKLSCPRRHFPMAKGVVVVDDDVTAPVPAEFPTSRRAPAGATMPGVVGGAWDEGPIYCIRLYQIWWDCQEMEDLPWMYGHAIE